MSTSVNKKRKGNRVVQFDSSKFVSENAQERYFDSVQKLNPIGEQGLCVTGVNWPIIKANIVKRGWEGFCAQPFSVIVPVVREFYANATKHNLRKVFVRGKQVPFSGHAINSFLKLPNIENDEYTAYLSGTIDYLRFSELLQSRVLH